MEISSSQAWKAILFPPTEDDVLLAAQPGTVEDTFSEISSVAGKAEQTLEKLGRFIARNEAGFAQTIVSITQAANEFSNLFSTLNTTGFGEKLGALEDQMLLCTERLNTLFLWEIIGTPIEGSLNKKEFFSIKVYYDQDEAVQKVEIL